MQFNTFLISLTLAVSLSSAQDIFGVPINNGFFTQCITDVGQKVGDTNPNLNIDLQKLNFVQLNCASCLLDTAPKCDVDLNLLSDDVINQRPDMAFCLVFEAGDCLIERGLRRFQVPALQ